MAGVCAPRRPRQRHRLRALTRLARLTSLPSGSNSVGRVSASQAGCRGFEPRLPLQSAPSCERRDRLRSLMATVPLGRSLRPFWAMVPTGARAQSRDMTIDPHGEAFLNERLATAYMLPVADLAVGRRFAPKTDFMYIAPSPRHAGGWPGPVWRVGSLEGVRTQYRWLVTADALVPIERLEPWQSFGPNGRRVVDIIERLYRFDPNDLSRVRRRLGNGRRRPIARPRIQVPSAMQAGLAGDGDPGVGPLGGRAVGPRSRRRWIVGERLSGRSATP